MRLGGGFVPKSSLVGLRKAIWWTVSLSASAVVLLFSGSIATAEGAAISMLSATGHENLNLGPGMRAPGAWEGKPSQARRAQLCQRSPRIAPALGTHLDTDKHAFYSRLRARAHCARGARSPGLRLAFRDAGAVAPAATKNPHDCANGGPRRARTTHRCTHGLQITVLACAPAVHENASAAQVLTAVNAAAAATTAASRISGEPHREGAAGQPDC